MRIRALLLIRSRLIFDYALITSPYIPYFVSSISSQRLGMGVGVGVAEEKSRVQMQTAALQRERERERERESIREREKSEAQLPSFLRDL